MFYIDPDLPQVVAAAQWHYERFYCFVRRKIGRPGCGLAGCSICASGIEAIVPVIRGIEDFLADDGNLRRILLGKPEDLLAVTSEFWLSMFGDYDYAAWQPYFDKKNHAPAAAGAVAANARRITNHLKQLKSIFCYDWFTQKEQRHYNAFQLTAALSRHTCTYCNRSYTATVIRKRDGALLVRPTLDHWFPKFNHPLLAVSFYNLIPSCSACNSSVKGKYMMNTTEHIHPYLDPSQTSDFEFGYFYREKLDQYRIFLKTVPGATDKARKTLQGMNLDEVYNTHYSELSDLLTIKKNYSGAYIESIRKLFGGKLSDAEVYRIAFGTEYEEADFYRRPLSKFKHDILKQLGLLDQ